MIPKIQESEILQNSFEILGNFVHFLQESYEFVRESQFLQNWYIALHFLQDTYKKFAKFASFM